jgi:hypothetical protein
MRLSALFAMAIVATSAVTLKDETELDSQLTTQEDMQVQEASTAEESATAMEALKSAMTCELTQEGDDDFAELEDGEESTAVYQKWNVRIQSATFAGRNVLNKVVRMYKQGKRYFPSTCQLFGGSCRTNRRDKLVIKYRLNNRWYTKTAVSNVRNSFIRLPDATKPKPKPVFTGHKPTLQKIIGAAQNGCGHWCKIMGGPLKAINRRSSSHWSRKSCTHSKHIQTGNWQSFGIPETREITDIKVLNRGDCCANRILQSSVFAGWKVCGTFTHARQLKGWAHFKCPK